MCNIRLSGYLDVPTDRLKAVGAALPEHIRLTLAEPGCLSFSVTSDPVNTGRFLVAEIFSDRAAFEAHQARVKTSDWGQITAGLAREYQIEEVGI